MIFDNPERNLPYFLVNFSSLLFFVSITAYCSTKIVLAPTFNYSEYEQVVFIDWDIPVEGVCFYYNIHDNS